MSVINTNIKALVAQNSLTVNNRELSKSMTQLSTGRRINSAADDAAGLAITTRMTSQIRGLNQAVRNANDGISMLQTAEGALIEITNMIQRMRELAVQSATDTNTSVDRGFLDTEFLALRNEIDRIVTMTQWNGQNLLKGEDTTGFGTEAILQVGANSGQTITVTMKDFQQSSTAVLGGISSSAITTQATATEAITALTTALTNVNTERATFGSLINRLTYTVDNLTNVAQNASESRSRILDTDYAQATTELARTQIIQQAATAMLAQANQQPQTVLALLK